MHVGGSWGPDGTILYAFVGSPIYRVSENGGASTAVTSIDRPYRQNNHRWPTFIDSRRFVYTAQGDDNSTGLYLRSLDSPTATRLVGAYSNSAFVDGRLLFVSGDALLAQSLDVSGARLVGNTVEIARPVASTSGLGFAAFAVSSTGVLAYTAGGDRATLETRWFDRQGKRLGELAPEMSRNNSYGETFSPDGRTVAMNTFRGSTSDLWLVDISRDAASRFTSEGANELYPVWSPDGSEILFASNRDSLYHLYRKRVDADASIGERLVFTSASQQYPTDWSRDGQILFTNEAPKTRADIWRMPASGDGKPISVLATSFNEYAARLSRDGRWMAYTSDESGRPEVYVQRFPTATGKVPVSTQGGSEPAWRADGKELFFVAANRTLNAVAVTTAGQDFLSDRPTKLFEAIVDTDVGSIHGIHYAATPDGQRFLITVSTVSETPTTVVLNWARWTKP
jgi:Tol biopolymer transport system component